MNLDIDNCNEFVSLTRTLPVYKLLYIGKRICNTDYAIRFYNNKKHKKFYHNRPAVEKAIRRAYAMGAFNHRERIKEILENWG